MTNLGYTQAAPFMFLCMSVLTCYSRRPVPVYHFVSYVLVPMEGLEPPLRKEQVPKTCVSTNFTTWAYSCPTLLTVAGCEYIKVPTYSESLK